MIVPDSSLLLYAYDTTSPKYDDAKTWWSEQLSGDEAVGLVYPVIFSFLRVSTNPRAFSNPLALAESEQAIGDWLDRHVTRVLLESQDHVAAVVDLLTRAGSTGGNLVTDAQIAAIAKSHNGTVHTADQDFRRFPGVKVHYPLEEIR